MGVAPRDIEIVDAPSDTSTKRSNTTDGHPQNQTRALSFELLDAGELLGVGSINITFKVHNTTAGKLKHFHDSIQKGDFAAEVKQQAHSHGVEVNPSAHVTSKVISKSYASARTAPYASHTYASRHVKPPQKQDSTKSAAELPKNVTEPKIPHWMPGRFKDAPAPDQLPKATRNHAKGQTGTFTRCAKADFNGVLRLLCPKGTKITKIVYADLGKPTGPWCGWNSDPMCSFPDAIGLVQ